MTEILYLSDPNTLRMLVTQDAATASSSSSSESPISLLIEFSHANGDSDIVAEDEEFVAVRYRNAAPVLRQPLETDQLKDGQNPDDTNGEGWREGTTIPENLLFTYRSVSLSMLMVIPL